MVSHVQPLLLPADHPQKYQKIDKISPKPYQIKALNTQQDAWNNNFPTIKTEQNHQKDIEMVGKP